MGIWHKRQGTVKKREEKVTKLDYKIVVTISIPYM